MVGQDCVSVIFDADNQWHRNDTSYIDGIVNLTKEEARRGTQMR
jgi:hypothetical protein